MIYFFFFFTWKLQLLSAQIIGNFIQQINNKVDYSIGDLTLNRNSRKKNPEDVRITEPKQTEHKLCKRDRGGSWFSIDLIVFHHEGRAPLHRKSIGTLVKNINNPFPILLFNIFSLVILPKSPNKLCHITPLYSSIPLRCLTSLKKLIRRR